MTALTTGRYPTEEEIAEFNQLEPEHISITEIERDIDLPLSRQKYNEAKSLKGDQNENR